MNFSDSTTDNIESLKDKNLLAAQWESIDWTQVVFFHDYITIQQDAEKIKYKNGHEFPLQWEFYLENS